MMRNQIVVSNFLMSVYTWHRFDGVWFVIAGLACFTWLALAALRKGVFEPAAWVAGAYVVGWLVVPGVLGYFSTYWGILYLPLVLVGTGGLVVLLLRLVGGTSLYPTPTAEPS